MKTRTLCIALIALTAIAVVPGCGEDVKVTAPSVDSAQDGVLDAAGGIESIVLVSKFGEDYTEVGTAKHCGSWPFNRKLAKAEAVSKALVVMKEKYIAYLADLSRSSYIVPDGSISFFLVSPETLSDEYRADWFARKWCEALGYDFIGILAEDWEVDVTNVEKSQGCRKVTVEVWGHAFIQVRL